MKFKIRLDYYMFKQELPEGRYAELRSIIPALPIDQPIKDFYHGEEHSVDIITLANAGFKFEVIGQSQMDQSTFAVHILEQLNAIQKHIESKPDFKKPNITLNLEQSHDAFLSKVNDVLIKEELCTDELRILLNEGWRIIAVCPQKGSRRPDYVLGRNKSESIPSRVDSSLL